MLKVYHNDTMVTAILTGCEYDAINYYSRRLTDTLNSQVPGCDSFNIIFNSFNWGKHSINHNLRLPSKFQVSVMINGHDPEDIIAAENAAKKYVLDGYHDEMRKAKLELMNAMGSYVSEVLARLADMSEDIVFGEKDTEEVGKIAPASKCPSMLPSSDYDNNDVPSFNDLVKAGEDALDEDDDPIEGDRVTDNSNFNSREPLTEKDEDDYTDDDMEPTDPIPSTVPVDEDADDLIPESNSDDIL